VHGSEVRDIYKLYTLREATTRSIILEKLGRLPEEDRHCAFLAAETLQEALNQYMAKTVKTVRPSASLKQTR
jgi:hypothetical protein